LFRYMFKTSPSLHASTTLFPKLQSSSLIAFSHHLPHFTSIQAGLVALFHEIFSL